MMKKDNNHLIWEQVRVEDDTVKAVRMIANISEQSINEMNCEFMDLSNQLKSQREQLHSEIAELRKVLLGNGDPSRSIVARLERIEAAQKKQEDNSSKVMWTVISAILVQIVMYLLRVL